MLKENGLGGYRIRQSDLAAWDRCQLQKVYDDQARENTLAMQPKRLSATEFGTVMHYALMTMEKLHYSGKGIKALEVATATFQHYWDPQNIGLIAHQVDEWIARQTYWGMRAKGEEALRLYYDALTKDESKLLALEYQFEVPIDTGDGRQHTLTGTVDRLSVRKYYGTPYISLDDFKTGQQKRFLRYNVQGSAYAYASLQPEFWESDQYVSFDEDTVTALTKYLLKFGYRLHDGTPREWKVRGKTAIVDPTAARRFRWINLNDGLKIADGGWRGHRDYVRLAYVIDQYIRANEAGLASPVLDGDVCRYCSYQPGCAGIGLPTPDHGMPEKRWKGSK